MIVFVGSIVEKLKKHSSQNTLTKEFIPQIALMLYVDTVVFHGGCNTLTEAMYYGKKMILLPFSSDQFNIAYDMETNGLVAVLDPKNFSNEGLSKAFTHIEEISKDQLLHWKNVSLQRGADYAAKAQLNIE